MRFVLLALVGKNGDQEHQRCLALYGCLSSHTQVYTCTSTCIIGRAGGAHLVV